MRGHIEERGGKWRVTVDVGRDPLTGKRRRVSETCDTKSEAEHASARIIAAHEGKAPSVKGRTVGEAIEAWWEFNLGEWAPATRKGYRSKIDAILTPEFGDVKLGKLTTQKIDAVWWFLARDRKLNAKTIRQAHVILSAVLDQAQRWGWLRENPAALARKPRVPKASEERAERGVPSVEDVEAVLAEVTDDGTRDTATLAIATGRRLGELVAVQWRDVDLDARTVTMRATITETGKGEWLRVTTGRKSKTATVALNANAVGMLKRRRKAAVEASLAFGVKLTGEAYVLSEEPGGAVPLLGGKVSSRWRYAARRAGVGLRFHDLRHLFVSRAIRAGVDLATIAHAVGHASTQVTSTVYEHVIEEEGVDRRASDVMGDLFDDEAEDG
jgi:integrase